MVRIVNSPYISCANTLKSFRWMLKEYSASVGVPLESNASSIAYCDITESLCSVHLILVFFKICLVYNIYLKIPLIYYRDETVKEFYEFTKNVLS